LLFYCTAVDDMNNRSIGRSAWKSGKCWGVGMSFNFTVCHFQATLETHLFVQSSRHASRCHLQ